jgi:hypothetical protein
MSKNSLRAFADRIAESDRITTQDVQELQRDVLADGITCREEAEILLSLDRSAADPAFADYLVGAIVDFAVWGARPTGYVDAETARWLAETLVACGDLGKRVAFEIVKESHQVDEILLAFAIRGSRTHIAKEALAA